MREEYKDENCEVGGEWLEGLRSVRDVSCGRNAGVVGVNTHKYGKRVFCVALLSLVLCGAGAFLSLPVRAQTLPAFPGAEGGGAESVGGRGGVVYEVTNLNSSGQGSLRAGIEMTGPRTIVFRVAGIINCNISGGQKGLEIRNPYLTIAGQTAPGGGITISGKNFVQGNCVTNYTHDVIIRYVRIRHGYTNYSGGDNISSSTGASNSIYDHLSLSWGTDENASAWGAPQNNLTYSWLMIYEPLMLVDESNFSKGFLTGSSNNASENMTNLDIHHSFMANTTHRNPLIKNKSFRLVNNIIYNWKFSATALTGGVNLDLIGNYYKTGPLRQGHIPYALYVCPTPGTDTPLGSPSIYSSGNMGYHNPNPANDDWGMLWEVTTEGMVDEWETPDRLVGVLPTRYRRTTPLPALPYPIISQSAAELESDVLPTVGASRRLDCLGNWVINRDTVDERVINEYHNLQGNYYFNEESVGGFPAIAPGTACTDTDHDGMPNQWETAKGLNPNNASDGPIIHTNGYSNLERYLNGESATTTPCNTVTTANFSQSAYNSYGAPFDAFQTSVNLMNAACTSTDTHTVTLTTGVTGDTTRIVYTKGYWYDAVTSGWKQYTGTCTGALNGEWCQGSVSATITDPNISTASSTNPAYLVGMTCSVQGGGWKCGCRDTTCANFSWQVQGAGM